MSLVTQMMLVRLPNPLSGWNLWYIDLLKLEDIKKIFDVILKDLEIFID